MGDLFHEEVTHEMFMPVWQMIESLPQHTFVILTKRPKLMSSRLFNWCFGTGPVGYLPNVWLGVSAENQARADERIPTLLKIPAAKRFVSLEPLLGAIDIPSEIPRRKYKTVDALDGNFQHDSGFLGDGLDWVIVGAESGPKALKDNDGAYKHARNIRVREWPDDLNIQEYTDGQ
jgi:protein gp37